MTIYHSATINFNHGEERAPSQVIRLKSLSAVVLLLLSALMLGACGDSSVDSTVDAHGSSAPTTYTAEANQETASSLPLADELDYELATQGFIAAEPDLVVFNAAGEKVWNQSSYEFIEGDAPASVNPSLWRQAKLNGIHGLFKVTDRIYQVRGYDLSNMSIIEGNRGWIIVDPLTSQETAKAAITLARKHLGNKPVVAVIFTHSHIDHFGGIFGVISEEDYRSGSVRVVAPDGFLDEATSENIIAGIAMARRASYMYGRDLPRTARGHIDSGLGKGPAYGNLGIVQPTDSVTATGQREVIDGLEFVFQNAPGSEAPAELTFAIPQLGAYCGAEVATRTLHNLYTLRGAKVRHAVKWSEYIDEMIDFSSDSDVYFASHHWPVWGQENIRGYLEQQRDTYKFIHDQTVRLFNKGRTAREIAEELELPAALQQGFSNRGYYGTIKHNSKAVYQAYLGWYDANPANLDSYPPVEAGKRYVELAGGSEALLNTAREAFDKGDYRWTAEILNHLVMAQPKNGEATDLLAQTYDQLGYQAESGPWRDVYLSAAYELRHGTSSEPVVDMAAALGMLLQTPVEKFFQAMSVRLDANKAEGVDTSVLIGFTNLNESYLLTVQNSVMRFKKVGSNAEAAATLRITSGLFIRMLIGDVGLRETLSSDELEIEGGPFKLLKFLGLFESPEGIFNIVTP